MPVGIIGLVLAVWLVPVLPTQKHGFDTPGGVILSGVGMFLIVFALQEGQSRDWAPWIWASIAIGVAVMAAFLYWQSINPRRAADPAAHLPRSRLLHVEPRGGGDHRLRRHRDDPAADVLCPGGLRDDADAGRLLTAPMAVVTGGVLAPLVGGSSTGPIRGRWSGSASR